MTGMHVRAETERPGPIRRRPPAVWLLLAVCLSAPSFGDMVTRRVGQTPRGQPARAARAPLPTGYAPAVQAGPKVDGQLDDACWRDAPVMSLTRTLDGNAKAAQPTEVRAVRDDKMLYLAVRCTEPETDKVRATRRSHDDAVWSDDSVEIFLGFGGTYFHIGVNAAGSTYDGKVKDASWDSGLQAAAARGKGEWTVELAIPLEKMVGEGGVPREWIANFNRNRYVAGTMEESAWSPTLTGDSHAPDRFGKLIFDSPPAASRPAAEQRPDVTVLPCQGGLGVVRFDLSFLPPGARIVRADLLVARTQPVTGRDDEALVDIEVYPLLAKFPAGGQPEVSAEPLKLRPPWFDRFDATGAVRLWAGGKENAGFFFKVAPFIEPGAACLDVAYEGTPRDVPPQVTGVKASHRAGQTFITWKEVEDLVGTDEIRWGQMRNLLAEMDKSRQVRYCVYRADRPITAATLPKAERIATVAPLSGWNLNGRNVDKPIDDALGTQYYLRHHQWNPFVGASVDGSYGVDCLMERLVAREGEPALPRAGGLYVHTANAKGKAFYAVVTCADGAQNTKDFSPENAPPQAVEEVEGMGEPVLQKEFPPKPYFNYKEKRLHYVRWVAPPYGNLPCQYYNWGVGVPENIPNPVPVELSLHRDGRSYYRTQYRVEQDTLVLSPHDFPVKTWWYGYHESLGTLKSFRQGAVHNYTERRLLAFLDWAGTKWPVDRNRVLVTGCAGGAAGSGALHLGIRHGDVFSLVLSGYGMADYAGELDALIKVKRAGTMPVEMEGIWGKVEWNLKTDGGRGVWDELNLTRVVAALPEGTALPLVTVTGHGMLRPMRDFHVAMLEKGQPFLCRYGVYGGGTLLPVSRTGTWSNMIQLEVRKDRPIPAFWGTDAGSLFEQAREPSGELVVSDGILRWWGVINLEYRWRTDDVVDQPARFEMTLSSVPGRRGGKPSANVTLRGVRNFRVRDDWEYTYEFRNPAGELIREGKFRPGKGPTFIFKDVPLPPEGVRVVVKP